jgi:hypothetical protein
MDARELPPRPNLEQYKKQAKEIAQSRGLPLAGAQFELAREHGFESWPRFRKHILQLNREESTAPVWEAAQKAMIAGDAPALERLLRNNQKLFSESPPPAYEPGGLAPHYSGTDARAIIAHNHQFESWESFTAFRRVGSPVPQFEAAADAVVTGNRAVLERLLQYDPELIRMRSLRKHHATLLHYVAANGVENFRQRTPQNIVSIADTLLRAGADVNTPADLYGGGASVLGLAVTSIYPIRAGVIEPLVELLLQHGAAVDQSIVVACLANGRGRGAELMAEHGAPLDLEGAAGVGRLDLVNEYFNEDGSLKPTATKKQMTDAFAWACQFGRTNVVDFLLERGMPVDAKLRHHGQTGLHWAAIHAHVDTVKLLLERGSPVNAQDEKFGGTPIGWARYGWDEKAVPDADDRYREVIRLLVAAGGH